MKWIEIPAGELHAAEQRLRVALDDDVDVFVERVNRDEKFVRQVANYIKQSLIDSEKPTTSQKCVREIMGKNFFGIEEAIKHFELDPTEDELATLSEIPFSEAVLQELKESHVLVAAFPISILEICSKVKQKLFCGYENAWYNNQGFAKESGRVEWILVQKTPVPNSTSKTWEEQKDLLGQNDEVPTAQVMVYTIIGHYLATGEHLFEHIYVRTSSLDSDGNRVNFGYFDSGGLYFFSYESL